MSIIDDLGKMYKVKSQTGTYGIEIETEVTKKGKYPPDFLVDGPVDEYTGHSKILIPSLDPTWEAVIDGSLRNYGVEYILKQPLAFSAAVKALELWGDKTKEIPFLPNPHSCSVHIHINMFRESFVTLGNFLTTWILFENILVEYSGEGRRSNLFALPVRCAEGVYLNIVKMFSRLSDSDPYGLSWNENQCKYGAVNLATLPKLGSLEVRTFRGSTDPDEIIDWLEIIERLFTFSKSQLTPVDILGMVRDHGEMALFEKIFGDKTYKLLNGINFESYVDRNLYYAGTVADSADWENIDKVFKNTKKPVKKKVESVNSSPFTEITFAPQMGIEEVSNLDEVVNNYHQQMVNNLMAESPLPPVEEWINFNNAIATNNS